MAPISKTDSACSGPVILSPQGMTEPPALESLSWRSNPASTLLSFVALGKHSAFLFCPFLNRRQPTVICLLLGPSD